MAFLTSQTFSTIEFALNSIIGEHLRIDLKGILNEDKLLIYDAVYLIYLFNMTAGNEISRDWLHEIYIEGIKDGRIKIVGDSNYKLVMHDKIQTKDMFLRPAIRALISSEYILKFNRRVRTYLFQYSKPIDIVGYAIENNISLPQEIIDMHNNIVNGEQQAESQSDNYAHLSMNDLISRNASEKAQKARINRRVKEVAEFYILKELAKKCTCLYDDLALYVAPTVFKESLDRIRETRAYSKKSDEGLLCDISLKADVNRWCEEMALEVFSTSTVYPDAKTRIKGRRKDFIPPPKCREHTK